MTSDDSKNKNSIEGSSILSLYSKVLKRNANGPSSKGLFGSVINALNPPLARKGIAALGGKPSVIKKLSVTIQTKLTVAGPNLNKTQS
jgi:hypothetical protein